MKEPGIVLVRRGNLDSPVRMDEAEYNANPSAHVLWDGETAPVVKTIETAPSGNPPQYLVTKVGKVFMVVDMSGNFIDVPGIDAGGYHSEVDAWNAVAGLVKK